MKTTMKEKIERAQGIVADVLETVKRRGAYQAEVAYAEGSGLAVSTRSGQVDTVEHNDDRSLSVTVYRKKGSEGALSKGSASTAILDPQAIALTIDKAMAIADLTEADPHAGLADERRLARQFKELKTWQPVAVGADDLIARALAAEAAAAGQGVTVDQSAMQCGESFSVLGNSHGFLAAHSGSTASASVVALAEQDGAMERDYWWDASRSVESLQDAAEIGRLAAERTRRRVGARKITSGTYPVLFEAPVAKTLVGHLLQAISGSALYQDASFLKGALGQRLFPEWFSLQEDPFVPGGFASRNFDSDGVQTQARTLVDAGVLSGYLLSTYAARRLGMESTGNAGGSHNIQVPATAGSLTEMLQQMGSGLLITEVMGQGINLVTGDYSRGASGFWVENGAIQYPVNEITIAGTLQDMFAQLQAVGNDTDRRSKVATGSWLIERMAVAGE
jgi:PmbA protein